MVEKQNFDIQMTNIIKNLTHRPQLLLHSCCGPCSTACLERLIPHFDVTVFYYNPNIMPLEEYEKRLQAQKRVCDFFGVRLLEIGWDNDVYMPAIKGLESCSEGGQRCIVCFDLRLNKTATEAKNGYFEYFTTTLTVSPHKNEQIINKIGLDISQKTGVKFLPSDFKKKNGFKRSIELSNELGLYRQTYCGCQL